jgi:hypothetical protein
MTWAELWQLASRAGGEQALIDACLEALDRVHDRSIESIASTGEVPTAQRLCYMLDARNVVVPHDTEARILLLYGVAQDGTSSGT